MEKSSAREALAFWTVVVTMGALFLSWATSRSSYKANPAWVQSYVLASLPENKLSADDLLVERGKRANTLRFTAVIVSGTKTVEEGMLTASTTHNRYTVVTQSSCEEYNRNCIAVLDRSTLRLIRLGYVM